MQTQFTIYNASAGSGKTYSLTKSYLQIILSTKNPSLFKHLLAITFTNKAAFEMKSRIIEMLEVFSDPKMLHSPNGMFKELAFELKISEIELKNRSEAALKHILHNYAAFNISTIDAFNQKLIRSFAFDLNLNQFFEIQLDSDTILKTAVENLLNLAGADPELTDFLTEFSKENINEDKNWDITQELLNIAKKLTIENDYEYIEALRHSEDGVSQGKSLEDFKNLKQTLLNQKKEAITTIENSVKEFFNLLNINQLGKEIFSGGYAYKFFEKLKENPEKEPLWGAGWQEFNNPIYATSNLKKVKFNTDLVDNELSPKFRNLFLTIKYAFGKLAFSKIALRNLAPLALINQIQNEIDNIKNQENILPIWEFNSLIFKELKGQPAPFIYERIGERFRHFFIDEFQDTSTLQWENLIPLISNALQSENENKLGSLLLVGDAKQSIYRWRGSDVAQFTSLYLGKKNPFQIQGQVLNLAENYRSLETIVAFNNDFFRFVSSVFEDETYRELYENAVQNFPESKKEKNIPAGFVSVQFVDNQSVTDDEEDNDEAENSLFEKFTQRELTYCQAVLETIEKANNLGVKDSEITVLVRKRKEGNALALFLSSKGRNIISNESLLLKNVASVQFIISLLKVLKNLDNQEVKLEMLAHFITLKKVENAHQFIKKYLDAPITSFFEAFNFSLEKFQQFSLYEAICLIINAFDLAKTSDAYITHFLDLIFDFKQKNKGNINDFLTFWEDEKDKLSISLPEGLNAITIMTVHKSKGLSAPVIIYAFADSNLVDDKKGETFWYSVSPENFNGFEYILLNKNKSLLNYSEDYENKIKENETKKILDEINVLYVAMTRPESFLFVITSLPKNTSQSGTYGILFKEFIEEKGLWSDEKQLYEFGEPIFVRKETENQALTHTEVAFEKGGATPIYNISTKASLLWDTKKSAAIEKGNLMHELLSKIVFKTDIKPVIAEALSDGVITQEQSQIIENQLVSIVQNATLKAYFSEKYSYFIERELLTSNGKYLRPDRIAFDKTEKKAIIIDYKTGSKNNSHILQINEYKEKVAELGWEVEKSYLVYLDNLEIVSV